MLEETLTDEQYFSLEQKNRPNPLKEIQEILKEYVKIGNSKNKQERRLMYSNLIKKYPKSFKKLNYPLISGIERLRVKYYRDLLFDRKISVQCVKLNEYIENMEADKEIFNDSLDIYDFNPKMYLLILTLTTTFYSGNKDLILNFFTKNILNKDNEGVYKNIKLLKENEYIVETDYEKATINGNDYILEGLQKDITDHWNYPLEILLLRNESYQKFQKDGGKGFLKKLGLYESFIQYIKYFIKSNVIKEALNEKNCYKNLIILLNNDNYVNEMLSEKHFRFLPLYGSYKHFGYTNKDLMVSFINSIPEIIDHIEIREEEDEEDENESQIIEEDNDKMIEEEKNEIIEEEDYEKDLENKINNLKNISLLFTIGVKFVTSLHEFIIHLMYAYIFFFSDRKIDTISFKEDNNNNGGDTFEKILNGKTKFECLTINSIMALLDGISCSKSLKEFQEDLHSKIDLKKINDRIKNKQVEGFLAQFIKKYPINFDYIKNSANAPKVHCRKTSGLCVTIDRDGPDTYGGGKAIK